MSAKKVQLANSSDPQYQAILMWFQFFVCFLLQAVALFVCAVASAPVEHDQSHAEVVRSEMVVNPDSFNYAYGTNHHKLFTILCTTYERQI